MSSKSEVTSALKLCSSSVPIPCMTCDTGIGRWCKQYQDSRPNIEHLEASVAKVMAEYDKRVEDSKQERERASQPDEEGWITVTRKSHKRKVIFQIICVHVVEDYK